MTSQNLALWAASRLVRAGVLRDLKAFKRVIGALRGLLSGLGTDRSGMKVRVFGFDGVRRVERCWTLVAERGDGPQIPCIAAPLVLKAMRDGRVAPGAGDAGDLLDLADFEPEFALLSVTWRRAETEHPPSLYRRVMGERFDALPPAVRTMHEVFRDAGAEGRAVVRRGSSPLAGLAAKVFGFPPNGENVPVHVRFQERDGTETWTRSFGDRSFRSRLSERGGLLVERFGLLRFGFLLENTPDGLAMILRRWWLGPVPLPKALAPQSAATEHERDGAFWFDVRIGAPLIGLLVHYKGRLAPLGVPAEPDPAD